MITTTTGKVLIGMSLILLVLAIAFLTLAATARPEVELKIPKVTILNGHNTGSIPFVKAVSYPGFKGEGQITHSATPWHRDMCIVYNQGDLWVEGTHTDDIGIQLEATTEIEIDGNAVESSPISLLTLMFHYDDDGQLIGTSGGIEWRCFNLNGIGKGTHRGEYRVTTLSGEPQGYVWEFRID